MSVPNPLTIARQAEARRQAAALEEQAKAKVVRPGLIEVTETYIHDGVVKSKNLRKGMVVQPYVHGKPRGSQRTVETVERKGNGAEYHVTFSSAHPEGDFKAAYRWYCPALDGATAHRTVRKPGFVDYQEV